MRFTLIFLLLTLTLSAQEYRYTSNNPRAIGFYESAYRFFNTGSYVACLKSLERAVAEDSSFIEIYFLQADVYNINKEYQKEIEAYNTILKYKQVEEPKFFLLKGEAELKLGQYKDAQTSLIDALKLQGLTSKMRNRAKFLLRNANFALEAMQNPKPYKPVLMDDKVNTEYNDYWPSLTADEDILITTVQIPGEIPNFMGELVGQEDFFISVKDDYGSWSKIHNMGPPINTQMNEGAEAISYDGQYLFFTGCRRDDGLGRCDIYFSQKIGDTWGEPRNIGKPVNTIEWESQPCMAADGRTLYFVSNRYGGHGGKDIWMTRINDYGLWEEPVNLGDSINTPYDEMSPFIHEDNKTLYFSSDGHVGMGQQDIFVARKKPDGSWGKPENLGYPLNTYKDEYGLIVNARGSIGMFASDREGAQKRDIFTFDMPKEFKPQFVSYVKGVVYDSDSKERIRADFELSDLETEEIVAKSKSIEGSGEYLVCLPVNKDYGLNISKDGYLFHSENFTLIGDETDVEPFEIDIPLQTIKVGRKVILNNIFFKFDSYVLLPKSKTELGKLVEFMTKYPKISIEISGHTDNIGTKEYNLQLSEKRAEVVYKYLIEKGITADRMEYKGYGYEEPSADNTTEEGRQKNRRTEFKIIKIR